MRTTFKLMYKALVIAVVAGAVNLAFAVLRGCTTKPAPARATDTVIANDQPAVAVAEAAAAAEEEEEMVPVIDTVADLLLGG